MLHRFRKIGVGFEYCFYIETSELLTDDELKTLRWLLAETFEPDRYSDGSLLEADNQHIVEVGPRLNFATAWSTNAVAICHACGLTKITRLERSRRYTVPTGVDRVQFVAEHHDRMTECLYQKPLHSFDTGMHPKPVRIIPLIEQGIATLHQINLDLGLGMDDQDEQFVYDLFANILERNPKDVELFQLGQANSEHSRHGFFRGRLIIDGQIMPYSLMEIIKTPLQINPANSDVAFGDDSSSIHGPTIQLIIPARPGEVSNFTVRTLTLNPIFSAESHNHPTGVEPYQGAATGTGGWLRDIFMMRLGGIVIATAAGYCTGNLHIPGYEQPWEADDWTHPANLASPLDIMIQASNGASYYGNCFGVPIIYGFTRACGLELPDGKYRSWFKPLMYAGGTGVYDAQHHDVHKPDQGMVVVQIGGPAYRIGVGGGSASSMISGDNVAELDFASVQRADPQTEQPGARVIKGCVELGEDNPILRGVDLGAGGDCNALPELVSPAGADIKLRSIPVGDTTLSTLEIWGNEAQERVAFLIWPDQLDRLRKICERERCPWAIVGQVTGDGYLILHDATDGTEPVNLPLAEILEQLPQKTFELPRTPRQGKPLKLPDGLTVRDALERVLRLPSVGSKRFLTTKVDRSVTGLIAQQQCVGPNQLTLSDYAVVAHSHLGMTGTALSIGEQPIKGLLSPQAMARLAVAEALLNMVGAKVTDLADIKCSANWMLAAKQPGEGAWLYDAACAVRDIMIGLGIAIDGGKDSLSMAAKTLGPNGKPHVVKAPGELIISTYVTMDDITRKVTPDLKTAGNSLLLIGVSDGHDRLGGSALAQTFQQVGDECPDVDDADLLKRTFLAVQELVDKKLIAAVHDRSDGGLIVTLLEMAFAGNVGLTIDHNNNSELLAALFSEEPGLVIECADVSTAEQILQQHGVTSQRIGTVGMGDGTIRVVYNGEVVLDEPMIDLRAVWESTSTAIDRHQADPGCVAAEAEANRVLTTPPPYRLSFKTETTPPALLQADGRPRVAIIREKGSNGDREMAAAFFLAGFEPWDVTMTDLLEGRADLDTFRGVAFVGGFSYGDVLDAAKGWAGIIRFNPVLKGMFDQFYARTDTFSLGVCNGCQLMALLGWVPWSGLSDEQQPRFVRNTSGRFESRWSAVSIQPSPAVMLRGMAGSALGIWIAHGEGRLHCPDNSLLQQLIDRQLVPMRYADEIGAPTEAYPFNPNGSPHGITALCSPDGRHLAMMPHPERAFLTWQWPWLPQDWQQTLRASPWLRMFQNAREWCNKK